MIAAGAAFSVQLLQRLGEAGEGLVVVESPRDETASLRQPLPDRLPKRGAGMVFDQLEDFVGEGLVVPIPSAESDQREGRGQQAAVGQVVNGRHHLLAGQIAGHAEDHESAWAGDSR